MLTQGKACIYLFGDFLGSDNGDNSYSHVSFYLFLFGLRYWPVTFLPLLTIELIEISLVVLTALIITLIMSNDDCVQNHSLIHSFTAHFK